MKSIGTAHLVVWPAERGTAQPMTGDIGTRRAGRIGQRAARRGDGLSAQGSAAGSTSSMSTPPASFGWMKLIREFEVPLRGAS